MNTATGFVDQACPTDDVLQDYLDGMLSTVLRRAVADHLKGCVACREDLAHYQGLTGHLETALSAPVALGDVAVALARIESHPRYQRAMDRLSGQTTPHGNETFNKDPGGSGQQPVSASLAGAVQAIRDDTISALTWLPRLRRSQLLYTAVAVALLVAARYAHGHRHGVVDDHSPSGLGDGTTEQPALA